MWWSNIRNSISCDEKSSADIVIINSSILTWCQSHSLRMISFGEAMINSRRLEMQRRCPSRPVIIYTTNLSPTSNSLKKLSWNNFISIEAKHIDTNILNNHCWDVKGTRSYCWCRPRHCMLENYSITAGGSCPWLMQSNRVHPSPGDSPNHTPWCC